MAVTRKQLAIRFVELHIFFLMEAKPDASFTFPQVHFFESTYSYYFNQFHTSVDFVAVCIFIQRFRMVLCLILICRILQDLQSSCFVARCSSMGNSLSMASTAPYTAYTAVLAQRRSTVAPNFGPLRHQSCQ